MTMFNHFQLLIMLTSYFTKSTMFFASINDKSCLFLRNFIVSTSVKFFNYSIASVFTSLYSPILFNILKFFFFIAIFLQIKLILFLKNISIINCIIFYIIIIFIIYVSDIFSLCKL